MYGIFMLGWGMRWEFSCILVSLLLKQLFNRLYKKTYAVNWYGLYMGCLATSTGHALLLSCTLYSILSFMGKQAKIGASFGN